MKSSKEKDMLRIVRTVLFLLAVCLMLPTVTADAATLKIKDSKKRLLLGESYTLQTNSKLKLTWSSSHPDVVSVNKKGTLTAKKAGKSVVTASNGKSKSSCTVTVKGTVDIIVFAGQSNMMGNGSARSAPKLIDGAGYTYNAVSNKNFFEKLREPFGRGQDNVYFQNENFATGSMVTAFVNNYYLQTRTPVIAVSATCYGSGSVSWVDTRYKGVIERIKGAEKLARANNLQVRHIFLVWMQGENDAFAQMPLEQHQDNLVTIFTKIKKKTKLKACFLITIPSYYNGSLMYSPGRGKVDLEFDISKSYKTIQSAQKQLCKKNKNFYLVSTKASELPPSYLKKDGIHIVQGGLNIIGKDAGTNAGKIAKQMK